MKPAFASNGVGRARASARAWTLIELLLVMTIISVMVALIARAVIHSSMASAYQRVRTEIRAIELALEAYKLDYGMYPLSPTTAANSPPTKWVGQPWPTGIGAGSMAGRTNYYYPQNAWGGAGNDANYETGSNYAMRVSACLWYYLYKAPIDAGKPPYLAFSSKQLTKCTACTDTAYQTVIDPWGNPYMYGLPSRSWVPGSDPDWNIATHNPSSFELISAGSGPYYWKGPPVGCAANSSSGPCQISSAAVTNSEAH